MREKIRFISLAMVLTSAIFGVVQRAEADSTYRDNYNGAYGTSVSCSFCHTSAPALNATGTKFKDSGFNVASIAPVPVVSAFSIPATSTSLTVSVTTLTATDNVPITGYMVTESSTPPTASATGWSASAPTSYVFAAAGAKTLYAWAKDAANVVSTGVKSASTTISVGPPPDTTAPTATITSPTSNPTYPATTTPLSISGSASDTVGVTQVTWSNNRGGSGTCTGTTSWSASGITLASGQNVITVAAHDAAGNTGTDTLTVAYTASTPPPETTPDMSLWVGQWVKVSIKIEGYSFGNTAASNQQSTPKDEDEENEHGFFNGERDRERIVGYLKIWSWDPDQKLFQTDLYESDGKGSWTPESVPLHYVGGDPLNFLCSFQSTGDSTMGFAVRIRGKGANGVLKGAVIQTLGGYYFEVDNTSNPPGSWAGEFSMNGTLVQEPKVPVPAGIRAH